MNTVSGTLTVTAMAIKQRFAAIVITVTTMMTIVGTAKRTRRLLRF